MDEAIKNRQANPHHYPAKRVSLGKRQLPKAATEPAKPGDWPKRPTRHRAVAPLRWADK
jgi:hypothetical protein